VQRRFLASMLGELLSHRYAQAWLLCEAAESYLKGPAVLRTQPSGIHERLIAEWKSMGPELPTAPLGPVSPKSPRQRIRLRRVASILWQLGRNLLLPDAECHVPSQGIPESTTRRPRSSNALGVNIPDKCAPTTLGRSRATFLRLLSRGLGLSIQLLFNHKSAIRAWAEEAPDLMTTQFWCHYLSPGARRASFQPRAPGPSAGSSGDSWLSDRSRPAAV
jgi:hypothetical protein